MKEETMMFHKIAKQIPIFLAAGLLFCPRPAAAEDHPKHEHWVGTWAGAPLVPTSIIENEQLEISEQGTTLREIVRITLGGDTFRVRFTNLFGTRPLTIGAAQIAHTLESSAIKPETARILRFHQQSSVSIPPGAMVVSDPVQMPVQALTNLTVSFYLPQLPGTLTEHQLASATSYQVMGDMVSAPKLPSPTKVTSWEYLNGIEVLTSAENSAIATLGDSITDGAFSTLDANRRWPDGLAERLQKDPQFRRYSVLNEAISGNKLLQAGAGRSALARFDEDVLAQSGVKYLIILEGINDIGHTRDPTDHTTAEDLIGALNQMIVRAHVHGIAVIGATLTPYRGANYFSASGEEIRQTINRWIRNGGAFDGVIDMDAAVRDPSHSDTLLPANDHGDHLHPNDDGYRVMGQAVDLNLFTLKQKTP